MPTIFALATARGRAGIAVIRVSGPDAFLSARLLCGDVPAARVATVRRLVSDGIVLDEALVLTFCAGASFTGEDVVEFHVHGGSAVVRSVLFALAGLSGLRQAEPGEFTRRALENGRLDLAQVEGLADLIDSETEAQRRQAMRILSGDLADRVGIWRQDLLRGMALLEATIDFSEEDLPTTLVAEVEEAISRVLSDLQKELSGQRMAERLRDGFEVALVGPPNIGKSTLLNTLAKRDAALTSPIAGTTRDVIEVRMELDGLPITFLDTAGIRETDDSVEQAGIARTKTRAQEADLRVFLVANAGDAAELPMNTDDILLLGKADRLVGRSDMFAVSGLTGQGIDKLIEKISSYFSEKIAGAGVVVHERHRAAGAKAVMHLQTALNGIRLGAPSEICSDEIRLAVRAVESLIGKVDTEELLGHIFGRFCIGK